MTHRDRSSVPLLRIFMCHSSGDKSRVRELCNRLKADGFSPWLDKEILPGQDWHEAVSKELRESKYILVCWSKEFQANGYRQENVRWVLDEAGKQTHGPIPIIPFKLEECEVPLRFSQHLAISLDKDDGYTRLLEALNSDKIGFGDWVQDWALGIKQAGVRMLAGRAEATMSKKLPYTIVLNGDLEDLDQSKVDSGLEHLRKIAGDSSLTIKNIKSGSIIIELEGEEDGYRVLQDLYKAGKLTTVFGLKIQSLTKSTAPTLATEHEGIKVVFSYSHDDQKIRAELDKHLSALKHNGAVSLWKDALMRAGDEFEREIFSHFDHAELILLLVSANFLASDYCYRKEMKRAMERHEAGEARVIPIIVSPVDWHSTPFGKLLALPTDGKPVSMWPKRDAALVDVAVGIRAAVEDLLEKRKGQPV